MSFLKDPIFPGQLCFYDVCLHCLEQIHNANMQSNWEECRIPLYCKLYVMMNSSTSFYESTYLSVQAPKTAHHQIIHEVMS